MSDDINKLKPEDVAYTLAKAGISSIPIVGDAAAELFGLIITPPLEKRRAEWMNDIAARLKALEDKNKIDIISLKDNEQFIDAVLQATSYALKTSEEEKIKAFQNAVINTAMGDAPDKTKSQIFLNQLDNLTVWHIKILNYIHGPKEWFKMSGEPLPTYAIGAVSTGILAAFPGLKDEEEFLSIIWNDLAAAGFISKVNLNMTMGEGMFSERTTQFGNEFLEFISSKE